MTAVLAVCALLVTVGAGWLLVKKYKPVLVLLGAGLVLLLIRVILRPSVPLLEGDDSSGSVWFDIIGMIESIAKDQLTGVGLIIMAAGGFSAYMNRVGATEALVRLVITPITKLKQPYLILVLAYVIGQLLFMVIPSAAGLAMLLVVVMMPIIVAAGVSPAAGAAVIATTSAMPIGPATGTEILAAHTVGLSPAVYFVKHQLPVAIPTIVAVAVTHFVVQRRLDRKGSDEAGERSDENAAAGRKAPKWYAIFLILPILLLVVFSPLAVKAIQLSTVSAFLLVWVLAVIVELIRNHDRSGALTDANTMFVGMGNMFAKVVSLIITAQLFAEGLKQAGVITLLVKGAEGIGLPLWGMAILFTLVVGLVTFLTGSGVGSFTSFASLAPGIASGLSGNATNLVTPMQFVGGLFRSVSPISGVVITVAGAAGISPMAVVRRAALPMLVGFIVMMASSLILI
ncbi:C4-dicarboxylate transporter DcuC [Cutibacterium sp.]|uniref:C4-dicarboxylate transporter DcuC n=1 Tax=Cutibacterium sp. TaxID=1912221 RepID=UPI0026DBDD98|nr:C4-dicarboxylate transporter DcuC [Cutibacterium sp.]MDO4413364.1 C4-dicarboxylate transporter DcuC [Cutibacterium sp.]